MTPAAWRGHYYDGGSAGRRPVTVSLLPEGLRLVFDDGASRLWPYGEIRQGGGAEPGEPARLERGGLLPELLVVPEPGFLAAVRAAAPTVARRLRAPRPRAARLALALGALLATLAAGAVLYLLVLPWLADAVARRVPVAWEAELGRAAVEQGRLGALARCERPEGVRALDAIVRRLTAARPGAGYTYRVAVVEHPAVNALAAPGGYVLVFRGLLEQAESPEELAGVLAHEIQHIEQRHGTRLLFREAAAGALLAAATGDAGQLATALGAARFFGQLRFSRQFEAQADREGMRTLEAARVAPDGLVRFLERMARARGEAPGVLRYLSTHPLSAERAQTLARLAAAARYEPRPLLAEAEWTALKGICGPPAGGAGGR
ncbi:MAG TPA: M48 family metallopeptidase [Thermodesulfobacteriota bacterium]|nr:M48 family metallopeptidase [Thermodesulfobacteriota bacterium]